MTVAARDRYAANLAALHASQPDVGRIVEAATPPAPVAKAAGRDGSLTFRVPGPNGGAVWFGQSSMPAISAEAVFAGLQPSGGNVWLPGVGTGREPLVVARKIPAHCAVFVLEPDPAAVKLAMHLYDYTPLLSAGRLVLILADDVARRLEDFFRRYPGFEQPTYLLTVPQVPAARIADVKRRAERACRGVVRVQKRALEDCVARIAARRFGVLPEAPRVALVSVDAGQQAVGQARRVTRALADLGWRHQVTIPDGPGKCHVAARMKAIEACRADLVVVLGESGRWMRPLLPPDLPIVAWQTPGCTWCRWEAGHLGPTDMIFTGSVGARNEVLQGDVPAAQVDVGPPGADGALYEQPLRGNSGRAGAEEALFETAIWMHVPDDRPEACGISLQSHTALWNRVLDIAAQQIDNCEAEAADAWLSRAERDTGVTLTDPQLRVRFVGLIRERVVPAAAGRAACEAVAATGGRAVLWGAGWAGASGPAARNGSVVATGDAFCDVFASAPLLVLPGEGEAVVQCLLDAYCAGVAPVLRHGRVRLGEAYPPLADVEPDLYVYRTSSELMNTLLRLRTPDETERRRMVCVRKRILAHHMVSSRLKEMVRRVRELQAARRSQTVATSAGPS